MIAPAPEPAHPRVGVGVLLTDTPGPSPEAGSSSIVGRKVDFRENSRAVRPLPRTGDKAREEVGVLLCVGRKPLPRTGDKSSLARRRTVSRVKRVAWFSRNELPSHLTLSARNAINALTRESFRRSGRALVEADLCLLGRSRTATPADAIMCLPLCRNPFLTKRP